MNEKDHLDSITRPTREAYLSAARQKLSRIGTGTPAMYAHFDASGDDKIPNNLACGQTIPMNDTATPTECANLGASGIDAFTTTTTCSQTTSMENAVTPVMCAGLGASDGDTVTSTVACKTDEAQDSSDQALDCTSQASSNEENSLVENRAVHILTVTLVRREEDYNSSDLGRFLNNDSGVTALKHERDSDSEREVSPNSSSDDEGPIVQQLPS